MHSFDLPRIKQLSESLANQIAAGEVVERPASVVKELLENCLDAGATHIRVEISQAGSRLIRVTDNGHGIHPDDLPLALARHATAKLLNAADLLAIHSLGFRGEALPSIASVASVSLTSRIEGREQAIRLLSDPQSERIELGPAAHPVGTTVEVSRLFHNTPARKKFLRSERTEFLHIQETLRRLALSRYNFSLDFIADGRKILGCRALAPDRESRVAAIMGRAFVGKAMALEHSVGDMRLWGWLGTGDLARSSSDRQYLYLNGRMIHDKRLNHAIRVAAEGQLAAGRYASYVLYLEMDAAAADVNVHPAKHEVRFRHGSDVHDFIYAALSASLRDTAGLYAVTGSDAGTSQSMSHAARREALPVLARRHNIIAETQRLYAVKPGRDQQGLLDQRPALGEVLSQLGEHFLLTRRDDAFLLVCIDATKKYLAREILAAVQPPATVNGRPLLVPVSYPINRAEEETLAVVAPLLADYALELELSAPGICRVRNIPNLLAAADLDLVVAEVLRTPTRNLAPSVIRNRLVDILVNHVCDIANPLMSTGELTSLLLQLQGTGLDTSRSHCPPLWTTLAPADLAGLVARNEG